MMDETHSVELVSKNADGRTIAAEFRLWEESPDNEDAVRLDLAFDDQVISVTEEDGFFRAMCGIRRQLEEAALFPRCLGACENVYPSPMIQAMGNGEKAYRLALGKQALSADLVCIFDTDDTVEPATVDQQEEFYTAWIQSL